MTTWLVCGGRKYGNTAAERVQFATTMDLLLSRLSQDEADHLHVIHGDAEGADYMAHQWAIYVLGAERITPYPADWDAHGRAAGPIRNQRMLDEGKPDLVIAFPGGRGTVDMVRRARKAGIEVVEVGHT